MDNEGMHGWVQYKTFCTKRGNVTDYIKLNNYQYAPVSPVSRSGSPHASLSEGTVQPPEVLNLLQARNYGDDGSEVELRGL